jgi:small subunit ribosomal protein S5
MMEQRKIKPKFNKNKFKDRDADPFEDKVVQVNRVSKKTKGGNKIGFSVLMVTGNRDGKVGVGLGKGVDVVSAIKKGAKRARKNPINVPINDAKSVLTDIYVKKGAAKILLKPAPLGSGLIAGGPVRVVVELAGIKNISSKILGTNNQASNVYATLEALKQLGVRSKVSKQMSGKTPVKGQEKRVKSK